MRIIFYGGRQAGMIQLLTLLALGHKVVCVIPIDEPVEATAKSLGLEVKKPEDINDDKFVDYLETLGADLFVCCHGRQIIKPRLLGSMKAINTHPCLYKYKGAEPIRRLLEDKNTKASVGVHWMAEKVDEGEVIVEDFKEVTGTTMEGVYNELYPLYSKVLIEVLGSQSNVILEAAKNGVCVARQARQEDSKRIWEIRNNPLIREYSTSKDPISFERHAQWFEQAYFQGKKNLCFVIECQGNVTGYCRFDCNDASNAYTISIAVDPVYHGKGLGYQLLSSSLLHIHQRFAVNAAVKKGNPASAALFKKSNFALVNEDEQCYYFKLESRADQAIIGRQEYKSIGGSALDGGKGRRTRP